MARPARYQEIADDLRIVVARLAPGGQLRAEADLAGEYDVGARTIRAALRVLAAEGVLELRAGYRARVRRRERRIVELHPGDRVSWRHPDREEQSVMGLHASAWVAVVERSGETAAYDASCTTFEVLDDAGSG